MAFQLMNWINGITKLNKTTMDTFQNNIKNGFDSVDTDISTINTDIEDINQSISNIDTGITSTITSYSNGYVVKYSDGVMEQVKDITLSVTTSQQWSSFYITPELDMGNWFEEFYNLPFVSYRVDTGPNAYFLVQKGNIAKLKIPNIHIGRNNNVTLSITVHIFGKGFWKEPNATTIVSETSNNEI